MAFVPVCRLCKIAWNEAGGCVTCEPAKKNSELKEDSVELESILHDSYAQLKLQLERLKATTQRAVPDIYNHEHARATTEMTKAVVTFAREFRSFLRQSSAHTQKLSNDEQAKLMADYFATWPERIQREFIQSITRSYNERKYGTALAGKKQD